MKNIPIRVKNLLLLVIFLILLIKLASNYIFDRKINIYVSPLGNDENFGTKLKPIRSLEKALQISKRFKKNAVNIYLREGVYYLTRTLEINKRNSRTAEYPLLISAFNRESVTISGGLELDFSPISQNDTNLINKKVRDKVYISKLKRYGIEEFGTPNSKGVELYYKNEKMTLARYPNEGNLVISKLVEPGTKIIRNYIGSEKGKFFFQGEIPKIWTKEKDIWVDGYWFWDWKDEKQQVDNIDTSKNIITLAKPYHHYGYREGQHYYIFNLLSELDSPKEWYLDRQNGKIYFYFPYPPLLEKPKLSKLSNLIEIYSSNNIFIRNITFELATNNGITVTDSENINFQNITLRHIGKNGLTFQNTKDSQIKNSEIHSIGGSAVILNGGNRSNLADGNNCVESNKIHNFSISYRSYNPGVAISGVGNCVRGNEIFDAPHSAIIFHGNNHTIENNDIHDVVTHSNDAGAIYGGRDWSSRGHKIANNYIHRVYGYENRGAKGIYLDDELSGITISGNVFEDVKDAVFIGGGRENVVSQNIFINSNPSIYIDARGIGWAKVNEKQLIKRLNDVPYNSTIWKQHYPSLPQFLSENQRLPVDNVIKKNIFDKTSSFIITKEALPFIDLKNNHFQSSD